MTADERSRFMNNVFAQEVKLLNRLTCPRKFGLIGLLFALPLRLLTVFLVRELSERIAFSAKERHGNEYLRPVQRSASDLRDDRGLTGASVKPPNYAEEVRRIAEQLQRDVQDIDAVDRKLGTALKTTAL
jgi:hypothetical protein